MIASIADEDALRPIDVTDERLWLADTRTGTLYSTAGDGTYRREAFPRRGRRFVVPGFGHVVDVEHTEEVLRFTFTPLGAKPIPPTELHGPSTATHRVSSVVPRGADRVAVVLTPVHGDGPSFWADPFDSTVTAAPLSQGTVVHGVTGSGDVIASDGAGWLVHDGGRVVAAGAGRVVGFVDDRLLVAGSRDRYPDWYVTGPDGTVRLNRDSRTVVSAALSHDCVTAYTVTSAGGQLVTRIGLDGASQQERAAEGTVVAHCLAGDAPVLRTTGFASGSVWVHGTRRWAGVADARRDLSAQVVADLDAPSVRFSRPGTTNARVVVTLHGGPDSHELDDLRYDGMYRDLVDLGTDVVAVNYAGSTALGAAFHQAAWQSWSVAVTDVVRSVQHLTRTGQYREVVLYGVSFGAWIAFQAALRLPEVNVVVSSPVLDLGDHISRHSTDGELRAWARTRFSGDDVAEGDRALERFSGSARVVLPEADEVVAPAASIRAIERTGARCTVVFVPGAHYPRSHEESRTRWSTVREGILGR